MRPKGCLALFVGIGLIAWGAFVAFQAQTPTLRSSHVPATGKTLAVEYYISGVLILLGVGILLWWILGGTEGPKPPEPDPSKFKSDYDDDEPDSDS